jgi:D-beta-D-heptose 7-phosphate kinase/D-beta-D-heptose 1-phosphate adenosyltransferase
MDYTVVGDIMLDKYVFCNSYKKCPEYENGRSYNIEKVEYHPGGAANVAVSLSSLCYDTFLIGGCGKDEYSDLLDYCLSRSGVLFYDFIRIPKTTVKTRIFYRNDLIIRTDYEEILIKSPIENHGTPTGKVIILSDYNKGMVSAELIKNYVRSDKFLVADPKGKDISKYAGVDLLTPNLQELADLTGESDYDKAIQIALKYVKSLLVTKSQDGMEYISSELRFSVPSPVINPVNVSGAGDLVAAGFTFHLTSGKTVIDSLVETNALLREAFSKNIHTTLHV